MRLFYKGYHLYWFLTKDKKFKLLKQGKAHLRRNPGQKEKESVPEPIPEEQDSLFNHPPHISTKIVDD